MLKHIFLAPVTLILTACSTLSSFDNQVSEFYAEALKRRCFVYQIDIYFAKLEPEIAGYCIPAFGILLNENGWDAYGPYQKKELVFHELGHCVLGLKHSKEGLMTSKMHSEKEVSENWSKWVDLLFKDCFSF